MAAPSEFLLEEIGAYRRRSKGSGSFLKKRTKKLSVLGALTGTCQSPQDRKFFCFFFFKKRSACLLSPA
jgi:hypothetical protein